MVDETKKTKKIPTFEKALREPDKQYNNVIFCEKHARRLEELRQERKEKNSDFDRERCYKKFGDKWWDFASISFFNCVACHETSKENWNAKHNTRKISEILSSEVIVSTHDLESYLAIAHQYLLLYLEESRQQLENNDPDTALNITSKGLVAGQMFSLIHTMKKAPEKVATFLEEHLNTNSEKFGENINKEIVKAAQEDPEKLAEIRENALQYAISYTEEQEAKKLLSKTRFHKLIKKYSKKNNDE